MEIGHCLTVSTKTCAHASCTCHVSDDNPTMDAVRAVPNQMFTEQVHY